MLAFLNYSNLCHKKSLEVEFNFISNTYLEMKAKCYMFL